MIIRTPKHCPVLQGDHETFYRADRLFVLQTVHLPLSGEVFLLISDGLLLSSWI